MVSTAWLLRHCIQETLENDNLALQNLSGSKYVQGNPKFLELVSGWQKKLGTVGVNWGQHPA